MRQAPSRPRARRALAIAASLTALLLPAAAADAAETFTDPGGSGASITIDKTVVAPGETLAVTGDGFVGGPGGGDPLVTLRPYDIDRGPTWTAGGADHYTEAGPHSTEAAHWFRTHQPGGSFAGTMRLPVTAQVDGPPPGGLKGTHWLRVLSGAYFTSTGDRVTPPISYIVPFTVVDNVTLGLTVVPGPPGTPPIFQSGTTFRAGAVVTLRGRGFTPGAPLTAQLDGTPLTTNAGTVTTDAEGATPPGTTLTIPAGTPVGEHVLRVATGDLAHEVTIRVTPPPSRVLATPRVRPGGTIAVSVKDYVGVAGKGQKVGIVIGSTVLACLTTDDTGAAAGTATIPADTAPGTVNLLYNAGTSCIPPPQGGTVNDQPISSLGAPLTVAADAPTIAVPGGVQGAQVAVTGEGLTPGPASVAYRGAPLTSALTVAADGRLSGTITLSEAIGSGPLVVTAGTSTAAAAVTVTARPVVVTPPATGDPGPPADPGPGTPAPVVPAPVVPVPPGKPSIAVVAGKVSSLKAKKGGRRLTVVVKGGSAVSTAVAVRSKAKVRLTRKGRAKIITLATRTLTKAGTYELTLTKDGRALLRRQRTVAVVVTVTPKGGRATRTSLRLKRA